MIDLKIDGEEHLVHRDLRSELIRGLKYMQNGEYSFAESTYSSALEKVIKTQGEDSRLTKTVLSYLAKSCANQGKYKMAALMYERLLLSLDENGLERISIKLELIAAYTALERYDEADILRGEINNAFEQNGHLSHLENIV